MKRYHWLIFMTSGDISGVLYASKEEMQNVLNVNEELSYAARLTDITLWKELKLDETVRCDN